MPRRHAFAPAVAVTIGLTLGLTLGATSAAHADVGVGAFVGEPTGLDVKLGLTGRTGLDFVLGWNTIRGFDRGGYGHVTYLLTPLVARGRSVVVPLRLGIGAAIFDQGGGLGNDLNVAARFPLELGLVFRRTPLELYGEIALKVTFIDEHDNHSTLDLDGGMGLRFYF